MGIAQTSVLAVVIALQLVLLPGCTTPVPATVTRAPTSPLKSNPRIFLEAAVQRQRIADALHDAGLRTAESFNDFDYTLEVRMGRNRWSTTCGGVSNVAYLPKSSGRYVLVIKGRGLTGSCSPNVFDDMSQMLASYTTN